MFLFILNKASKIHKIDRRLLYVMHSSYVSFLNDNTILRSDIFLNIAEMLLPERGNLFYAIKNDVDDVIFVVRKRTELGRHKFKQHNRTKNRISKFVMNV